jgi:hypothetical protein
MEGGAGDASAARVDDVDQAALRDLGTPTGLPMRAIS